MVRPWTTLGGGLLLVCLTASAQTAISLKTQATNIDFTGASMTKPFKTGATLPESCSTGEAFLLNVPPASPALFVCGTPGLWTLVTGSNGEASTVLRGLNAGPGIVIQDADGATGNPVIGIDDAVVAQYSLSSADPAGPCDPGRLHYRTDSRMLWFCGAAATWRELASLTNGRLSPLHFPALTGDVTSAEGTVETSVVRLQGRDVADADPGNGQAMVWSSANQRWEPGTIVGGTGGGVTSVALSGTDRQIRLSGTCVITASGTCVLSLPADLQLPIRTAFTPSTTQSPAFNLPSGTAPAAPVDGDFWNLAGVLQYRQGDVTHSLATGSAASITEGTLAAERGGLGTDASAFNGILKMQNGGATVVGGEATDCVLVNGGSGPCGGAIGPTPSDASTIYEVDEFTGGGTATGVVGKLGGNMQSWAAGCTSPVTSYAAGNAANPWLVTIGCGGTTDGHGRTLAWYGIEDVTNTAGWVLEFLFRLDASTNNRFRAGLTSTLTGAPSNFIGVRADSNGAWDNAATPTFKLTSCTGTTLSGCADLDLGVVVNNSFHRLRLSSDSAGTIKVLFDSLPERTICASASCSLNAAGKFPAPSVDLQPSVSIGQEGTLARTITLDRLLLGWTGRTGRW